MNSIAKIFFSKGKQHDVARRGCRRPCPRLWFVNRARSRTERQRVTNDRVPGAAVARPLPALGGSSGITTLPAKSMPEALRKRALPAQVVEDIRRDDAISVPPLHEKPRAPFILPPLLTLLLLSKGGSMRGLSSTPNIRRSTRDCRKRSTISKIVGHPERTHCRPRAERAD